MAIRPKARSLPRGKPLRARAAPPSSWISTSRTAREQLKPAAAAYAFRNQVESQLGEGTYRPEAPKVTVREVADLLLKHCGP
jgi:hypothetical protein